MESMLLDEGYLKELVDRWHDDSLSHGKDHVLNVVRLCKELGSALEKEGRRVDFDVLLVAAYLHDLGRYQAGNDLAGNRVDAATTVNMPHGHRSALIAREILLEGGIDDGEILERVQHCILAHSFSEGVEPTTLEAMILSDADKLDAMGARGIIRTVAYSVENGRSLEDTIEHFTSKISKLNDLLYTNHARKMARAKHRLLVEFLKDLSGEQQESDRGR